MDLRSSTKNNNKLPKMLMMKSENSKPVFKVSHSMPMTQISELSSNHVEKFLTSTYSQDLMENQRVLLSSSSAEDQL